MERFLLAFEASSLLLLIAAVGAVVLAGRKREGDTPYENSAKHSEGVSPSL
jgi:hypothetical protein